MGKHELIGSHGKNSHDCRLVWTWQVSVRLFSFSFIWFMFPFFALLASMMLAFVSSMSVHAAKASACPRLTPKVSFQRALAVYPTPSAVPTANRSRKCAVK
jgi:hypothetical protein